MVPDRARYLFSDGAVNDGDFFVVVQFRKNLSGRAKEREFSNPH